MNFKAIINSRPFWTCRLELCANGWYYWMWSNWVTGDEEMQFAGYNSKALNRKKFKELNFETKF